VRHGGQTPSGQLIGLLAERGIEPVVRAVTGGAGLPAPGSIEDVIITGWERAVVDGHRVHAPS
jgi:hypothetical protein